MTGSDVQLAPGPGTYLVVCITPCKTADTVLHVTHAEQEVHARMVAVLLFKLLCN
jgi:hypothetical protein